MITYPDLIGEIRKDILKRIARSRIRKQIQTGDDQFLLNIYVSKDRKKSSIKCLKDKLRYRQGNCNLQLYAYLLKTGLTSTNLQGKQK